LSGYFDPAALLLCPALVKLKVNRFGPSAGESRPSILVSRQFVVHSQDLADFRQVTHFSDSEEIAKLYY